jgi:hypothetical protein
MFRPYDPVIRSGEGEFVCAVSGLDEAGATKRLAVFHTVLESGPEHGTVVTGVAELQSGDSREDVVARSGLALHRNRRHRT